MPDRPAIRAAVFDLDDTLYPERDYVLSGYRAVQRHLRQLLSRPEEFAQWLWQRFLGGRSAGALEEMNEHFRLGLAKAQVMQLVEVYRNHSPDIRPYADIPELLARLHGRMKLGLLTDGYLPAQQHKLRALNLESFFDAVVFTESLGRDAWKPSARGFEEIAARLMVDHPACAYVADNPAKDFVAPNSLGWRTIQFRRPGQVHADKPTAPGGRPQAVVQTADELIAELTGRSD